MSGPNHNQADDWRVVEAAPRWRNRACPYGECTFRCGEDEVNRYLGHVEVFHRARGEVSS